MKGAVLEEKEDVLEGKEVALEGKEVALEEKGEYQGLFIKKYPTPWG